MSLRCDDMEALASAVPSHGVGMSRLREVIPALDRKIGPHDREILSIRFAVSRLALEMPRLPVAVDALRDKISTLGDQMPPIVDDVSPHVALMTGQIREMPVLTRPMRAIGVARGSDWGPDSPLGAPVCAVAPRMWPLTQPIGPQLVGISWIPLEIC